MDMREVIAMLDRIQRAYPKFMRDVPEDKMPGVAQIWQEFLADEDAVAVSVALNEHIITSPYPPAISDIKGRLVTLKTPSAEALWDELTTAAQNAYGYDYMPVGEGKSRKVYFKDYEYDKLSAPLKRLVGNANGLVEFRSMLKEDALKARNMFDRKIGGLMENTKNEDMRKQIEQSSEPRLNAENVRKIESISASLTGRI